MQKSEISEVRIPDSAILALVMGAVILVLGILEVILHFWH